MLQLRGWVLGELWAKMATDPRLIFRLVRIMISERNRACAIHRALLAKSCQPITIEKAEEQFSFPVYMNYVASDKLPLYESHNPPIQPCVGMVLRIIMFCARCHVFFTFYPAASACSLLSRDCDAQCFHERFLD